MSYMRVGGVAVIRCSPEWYRNEHDRDDESDEYRYVLVEETKKHKKGYLNLPGGDINMHRRKDGPARHEKLRRCVVREAKEESGLVIRLLGEVATFFYEEAGQEHHVFVAEPTGGQLRPSKKHPSVDVYTLADVEKLDEAHRLRSTRVLTSIRLCHNNAQMLPLEQIFTELRDDVPIPIPRDIASEQ